MHLLWKRRKTQNLFWKTILTIFGNNQLLFLFYLKDKAILRVVRCDKYEKNKDNDGVVATGYPQSGICLF